MTNRQSKIHGALLGAAIGDAMGAVTEGFTPEFLKIRYSGYLKDLVEPTNDGMTINSKCGMVSDDFSVAYYTAEVMIENSKKIDDDLAVKGLLRWWEHPEFTCYCGPSTRLGIMALKGEVIDAPNKQVLRANNELSTNGGGMKSGMMGLFNPCDIEGAVADAITMCQLTHNNMIALGGACAIAASTAVAFKDNISYIDLINVGYTGMEICEKLKKDTVVDVYGCSNKSRLDKAVELGLRNQGDFERAMIEIADTVGCGIYAYEAIPAAYGMIAACKGDLMDSIYMAVNAGSDSDSLACMIGYILGAYHGDYAIPLKFWNLIDSANNFDLKKMAVDIDKIAGGV